MKTHLERRFNMDCVVIPLKQKVSVTYAVKHLNTIKELRIKTRFIKNLTKRLKVNTFLASEEWSSFITWAFLWETTEEGYDYWFTVSLMPYIKKLAEKEETKLTLSELKKRTERYIRTEKNKILKSGCIRITGGFTAINRLNEKEKKIAMTSQITRTLMGRIKSNNFKLK